MRSALVTVNRQPVARRAFDHGRADVVESAVGVWSAWAENLHARGIEDRWTVIRRGHERPRRHQRVERRIVGIDQFGLPKRLQRQRHRAGTDCDDHGGLEHQIDTFPGHESVARGQRNTGAGVVTADREEAGAGVPPRGIRDRARRRLRLHGLAGGLGDGGAGIEHGSTVWTRQL